MINKNLDFNKLHDEYNSKRRISISDFIEPDIAEVIYQGLIDLTKRNLWYQVNYGNPKFYNPELKRFPSISAHFSYKYEKYPIKNIPLQGLIELDSNRSNTKNLINIKEAPELELPHYHPLRIFGDNINSDRMHDLISRITGHELSYGRVSCFASKYSGGDYNGAHNDGNNPRRVAFILNMTKNWLINWGGNLAICNDDYNEIEEVYLPKFNNLILFDVPLPHVVLPVSIYCQSERYALTGWFHKYE